MGKNKLPVAPLAGSGEALTMDNDREMARKDAADPNTSHVKEDTDLKRQETRSQCP